LHTGVFRLAKAQTLYRTLSMAFFATNTISTTLAVHNQFNLINGLTSVCQLHEAVTKGVRWRDNSSKEYASFTILVSF